MGTSRFGGIEQAKVDGKSIGGLRGKTKERNEQKTNEANHMAKASRPSCVCLSNLIVSVV